MSPAELQDRLVHPVTWRAYGLTLRPLTLGHARLLATCDAGSPLFVAFVCSRPWYQAPRWVSSWWLRLVCFVTCAWVAWRSDAWRASQAEIVERYVKHHCELPHIIIEGNGIESDTPVWDSVLVFLMREFSMRERYALDLPLNDALTKYYVALEHQGACRIVDADEYTRQADALHERMMAHG
jgi:hypothetical protein